MMPDNVASSSVFFAPPMTPVKRPGPVDSKIAWEMGGVALNDTSQGVNVKLWTARIVIEDNDDTTQDIVLSAPGVVDTVIYTGTDITEIDIAFDQNMNPAIAYTQGTNARLRWYDGTLSAFDILTLPAGSRTPRICLDDHRPMQVAVSDIVLMYIRGSTLYMRKQRDRFLTEYTIKVVGPEAELVYITMNNKWRLQWQIHKYSEPLDDAAILINDPFLGDVVLDLCMRAGVPPEAIDVSELYEDRVPGYLIKSDEGTDSFLTPLSQFFFFDPTEYDRKLHFYKRGRDVVIGIHHSELVASNNAADPMSRKVVDTAKLPKIVNVSHLDPAGNYARNKQPAERKSNLIKAKANKNIEANLVLEADQAASIAWQTLKMHWYELIEYAWSLPIGYSMLVPADVFNFFAKDGSTHRIRITSRNEDKGIIKFEGKQDGGIDVYQSHATGLSLPYPDSTTPGLVGETRLEVLNLPALRDQDDELGVYIAIAGENEAWYGAAVQFSTDGVTYVEAFRSEVPATLGETLTVLLAETSSEYPSDQTLDVTSNFALESISDAELFNNGNRFVVGDQIGQFKTALPLGGNQYRLSGLILGRYSTEPVAYPVGTRFVMLDSSIMFMQAQQWMLGMEIWLKPVSFGVSDDESTPTSYEFTTAYSQREWAPGAITAARNFSNDDVTVAWIPRPRLGIETAPRNSKYFTGYRVTFSDGFIVDTTNLAYTRTVCPSDATVHIAGLNSITGEGELSPEIPTYEGTATDYIYRPMMFDGSRLVAAVQREGVWVAGYSDETGMGWAVSALPVGFEVTKMAFGLGLYVAGAGSTSWFGVTSDLDTAWTSALKSTFPVAGVGGALAMPSLFFDGTKFVAAGASGVIVTSTDGVTWTEVPANTLQNLGLIKSLVYDGVYYYALFDDDLNHYDNVYRSTDLATWTLEYQNTSGTESLNVLRFLNSRLLMLGSKVSGGFSRPMLMVSDDNADTWTDRSPVPSPTNPLGMILSDCAYFNSRYVIFASNLEGYSADLLSWTLDEATDAEALGFNANSGTTLIAQRLRGTSPVITDLRRTINGAAWSTVVA